jgi:hypothetical protein
MSVVSEESLNLHSAAFDNYKIVKIISYRNSIIIIYASSYVSVGTNFDLFKIIT